MAPRKKRKFKSGATRNDDKGKLDYEGFLSPEVLKAYAKFMNKNREMEDGTYRDSDNWKKGVPIESYMKSMWRHFMDVWLNYSNTECDQDLKTSLCAMMFNVSGMLHEVLKESDTEEWLKSRVRESMVEPSSLLIPHGGNTKSRPFSEENTRKILQFEELKKSVATKENPYVELPDEIYGKASDSEEEDETEPMKFYVGPCESRSGEVFVPASPYDEEDGVNETEAKDEEEEYESKWICDPMPDEKAWEMYHDHKELVKEVEEIKQKIEDVKYVTHEFKDLEGSWPTDTKECSDPSLLNKVSDIKGKFEFVPVGGGTLQLHEKWKPDNNKNKD